LRTAAAAETDVVILLPGCVDPYNPKVLRGGMGAHFRLPILSLTWPHIVAQYPDLPLYVADAAGTLTYDAVDWRQPAGVIIGGEARGAQDTAYQHAAAAISIPMGNRFESLNAAMATAIILFECRRQRRQR
jgi:TrmH family RNA methyltransferase